MWPRGGSTNCGENAVGLTGPPEGYHSVYGTRKSGGDSVLNYDEIVLFDPDAISPLYVFMYILNKSIPLYYH